MSFARLRNTKFSSAVGMARWVLIIIIILIIIMIIMIIIIIIIMLQVGWVLQCLDNVGQDSQCSNPPCAIVPLGTGFFQHRSYDPDPGTEPGSAIILISILTLNLNLILIVILLIRQRPGPCAEVGTWL